MRGYTKDTPIKEAIYSYTVHTHEQPEYAIIPIGYFDEKNIPEDIEFRAMKNTQILYLDHVKINWQKGG